jgi:hypothetical protein
LEFFSDVYAVTAALNTMNSAAAPIRVHLAIDSSRLDGRLSNWKASSGFCNKRVYKTLILLMLMTLSVVQTAPYQYDFK